MNLELLILLANELRQMNAAEFATLKQIVEGTDESEVSDLWLPGALDALDRCCRVMQVMDARATADRRH